MDRHSFRALVRNALLSIHDIVALEKSSLSEIVPRADPALRRTEVVKRFLTEGIEQLRPDVPLEYDTPEWRYYRILAGRYLEGLSMGELENRLALGERQLRRMHSRALVALEDVLWERLYPDMVRPAVESESESASEEDLDFAVTLEPLLLDRVLEDTTSLFRPHLQARGGDLSIQIPPGLPAVQADRILLRQVLLHLFNRVLQGWAGGDVLVNVRPAPPSIMLDITALSAPENDIPDDPGSSRMLVYSLRHLNARMTSEVFADPVPNLSEAKSVVRVRYRLELAMANAVKVLVVDDHEPAIRIIQRYLNATGIQVIGLSDSTQVMVHARAVRPHAVLLDVMMPAVDGWEILQKLKSDPETRQIPVIICSVWDQPDLAYSLGANGFIKKPISQADLMAVLKRAHLLENVDGSLRAGS